MKLILANLLLLVVSSLAVAATTTATAETNPVLTTEEKRDVLRKTKKNGKRGLQGNDGNDGNDGGAPGGFLFGFLCFSGSMVVDVQGKGLVSMSTLQVDDMVRTDNDDYTRVVGFGKFNHEVLGQYVQLYTDTEEQPLELTHDHMVFLSTGKAVAAKDVRVGDMLHGNHKVVDINTVIRKGAYAPITETGTLLVNGVLSSSYTQILDHAFFDNHGVVHAFMTPFRRGFFGSAFYERRSSDSFLHTLCPMISSMKFHLSPNMQYMVSFVAIPIYFIAFVLEHLMTVTILTVLAMHHYNRTTTTSKVKNA